jgi:immune inhibitor A
VALVAGGIALAPYALAQPDPITTPNADETKALQTDDLPNAMEQARRAAREEAIAGVLAGKYTAVTKNGSTVVDLGANARPTLGSLGRGGSSAGLKGTPGSPGNSEKPRFVEIGREKTDQIFVILVQFGNDLPAFPLDPNAQRHDGPLHNEIPAPDRSVDNSTVWRSDFSQSYFQDLYFGGGESLKHYMETQSSGRYSVDGTVTNWVRVNFTQGRYGTDRCGSIVCSTVLLLVRDAAKAWVQDRLANGVSMAQIQAQLADFDKWDRYDLDGDGNFNEPDGFLDHFQIVHAGGDEADGDPIYATDAIWSHRSYSNLAFGPTCNDPEPASGTACITGTPIGGTIVGGQITNPDGTYTGMLIGDYTMQPENGGRSVFYHEYTHDLGLPDDYNIISGGDNNNEHWTLMAQSRLGAATDEGIGERAGDMGAWNKLQLGWLNHATLNYNQTLALNLGPQEFNTSDPQGVVVVLPTQHVSFDMGQPASGDEQFYSGHTDDSFVAMSRQVTVPAGGGTLTLKTRWDIEKDFDAARVTVDGNPVVGTVNGAPTLLPNNQNGWTVGWDGTQATYVDGTFPIPAGTHQVAIEYLTDAAVGGNNGGVLDGVFVDSLALNGTELSEDGWTLAGFSLVGAQVVRDFEHFYIAGTRSYISFDQYLQTGPYFFGYGSALPDKVDHYAYQQGLLISYWNTLYTNNDTFQHPGFGRNLYIDAHPAPMPQASGPGGYWRARVQVYDAPFGLSQTDTVTLHVNGAPFTFGGLPGVSTFNDTGTYWFAQIPNHGVKLPAVGVQIRVLSESGGKTTVKVN